MSGARSRRLQGSLGESWGDAEYESEEGASIHTASDFDSEAGSEMSDEDVVTTNEHIQGHEDFPTSLPSRVTRANSKSPQITPAKTPTKRVVSRQSQSQMSSPLSGSKSYQTTPGTDPLEPSFIMPSMNGSLSELYQRPPLATSQVRSRKPRRLSSQQPLGSSQSSPRIANRRTSTCMASTTSQAGPTPGPWHYLDLFRQHVFLPILQYILGVGGYAMEFLKPVFALALAVGFIVMLLTSLSGLLRSTVQGVLAPVCIIPGSSFILPFCATSYGEGSDYNEPDFEELMHVQSRFEDIVENSKDSSTLPATMKQSENAIQDLKSLVRWSKLPSRSELEVEFDYFIATAKEASDDLVKYNSKIGATMDRVISTNKWTMQVLQGLSEKEAAVGSLSRVVSALNPVSVFIAPPPTLQEQIYDQYIRHVVKDKEDISNLIEMAVALTAILNNLEGRLETIASIAARDDDYVSQNRDELLARIWTKLGGNSATRKGFDKQLKLLKEVTGYRREAMMHVSTTLLKLKEIAAGLENLRTDVAAPETLGFREEIPLSYHLEVIEKAVERLQDVRGETRRIEREAHRRILRSGDEKSLPDRPDEMPLIYAKPASTKR